MPGIRDQLQPLELLDLQKCATVGKIVDGLSHCSFGGRMLGDVCATIEEWIKNGRQPILVCDYEETSVHDAVIDFVRKTNCGLYTTKQFIGKNQPNNVHPIIMVGHPDGYQTRVWGAKHQIVFINTCGFARPGQIQDGFFPNAIFADPSFVLPVLGATLRERLNKEVMTVVQLMDKLQTRQGLGQEVYHGYRTLRDMVDDPDCTVFMTLSGAMTIAKMGLVICDIIDRQMVQYIASTGALMAHGLVESVGLKHYKHDPQFNDEQLGEEKLNRVTDTLEPEENLDQVATVIGQVLETVSGERPISPTELNRLIGQHLVDHYPEQRGILKSALAQGVPVAVPAFVDSEVGNDVYVHNRARRQDGRPEILMNLELDSQTLMNMFVEAKRRGIFTIGGGVPRNNTQNVAPLIEITNARLGTNIPEATYDTGCRICPDPMWLGHLSGCTYSENASWRKMDPQAILQGKFAEVHGDAAMILPFIIRAIMDGHS